MTNEQYTNIMVAIAEVKTEQKGTNEHLKTLNGKVAANVSAIKHLEQEDMIMNNDLKTLLNESKERQDNTQWWQRHFSGIMVTTILGAVLLVLQLTGILNLNL